MFSKRFGIFLLIGLILLVSGCTRTIKVDYKQGDLQNSGLSIPKDISIGIAKFQDQRSWIDPGDEKSKSFIAQQGPWRFGLSYNSVEYYPLNDTIQDIFVSEFKVAGIDAKKVGKEATGNDVAILKELAISEHVNFILGGQILTFEYVNETGVFTVTSRRSVTLSLILLKADGSELFKNSVFSDSNRENEGMGVLHSTNMDKLFNGVFKNVISQVLKALSEKLSVTQNDINVNIYYSGVLHNYYLDKGTLKPS
jgi:hypothetical protein